MTAQIPPDLIYRVILDYEALQDGFADRIEDLGVSLEEIDSAGGFTKGNAQKLLVKSDAKWARKFGWESLGKILKGTGLALALLVDDERFAPIKEQFSKRKRPPRSIVRRVQPRWLFTRDKARELSKRRWSGLSDAERSKMMKKVRRAGMMARRRKARKSAVIHGE